MYFPDDDLYSIGALGVLEPSYDHDTASDVSDWVLQYTAWGEDDGEEPQAKKLTSNRN